MSVKFSEFTQETVAANVTRLVGYTATGDLNIQIPPANLDTTYTFATSQDGDNVDLTLTGAKTGTANTTEVLQFTAGSGVTLTAGTDAITIAATGAVTSITATAPIARDSATGAVTISLNDAGVTLAKLQNVAANSLLVRDANSSGVLTEKALANTQILIGDGTGMTAAALSGDVTMANTGAVTIADNAVDHDQLANRYTVTETVTNTTGPTTINWANAAVFKMNASLTGGIEFDFTGFKTGQVISIYNLTGSQTVTFDSDAGTSETFNKVGGVDYAGGSTNLLQVECVDDSANAVFNYSVAAYVSDPTPS